MKQKEVLQLSYAKGIVENVRQDIFAQKGALESVLYLQNFNPNLESLSLVVRPGEITDSSKSFIKLESYVEIAGDNEFVKHLSYLQTSNPVYNDTLLLFFARFPDSGGHDYYKQDPDLLQRIEGVGIIALVPDVLQNNYPTWQEPFTDGKTYPGWYPLGSYQDSTRFGESILFVTKLSDITKIADSQRQKKLFPCYVWNYWDLTKKRDDNNQYFNGLTLSPDITDKNTYTGWRVKNPSMMLQREQIAGAYAVVQTGSNYGLKNMKNNTVTDYSPISLVFWQSNLYEDQYHELTYQDYKWDKVKADISIEIPNLEKYIDSYISNLESTYSLYGPLTKTGFGPYTSQTFTLFGPYIHKQSFRASSMFRQPVNKTFDVLQIGTGQSIADKSKYEVKGSGEVVFSLPFLYPNYIKSNLPRPFIQYEKIPFVLTAKINGTEVVILKDTYEIQNGNGFDENLANIKVTDRLVNIWYGASQGSEIYDDVSTNREKNMLIPMNSMGKNDKDLTKSVISVLALGAWFELKFTLRISPEGIQYIIDNDITSFKLYVSKPDEQKTILKSIGSSIIPVDNTPPYYGSPVVSTYKVEEDMDDYMNYKFVKEFLIDGRGTIIDDYKTFDGNQGSKTNSWVNAKDDLSNKYGYWAIPQEEGTLEPMQIHSGSGNFDFYGSTTNEGTGKTWTPDFVLWDYPYKTGELVLGGSGKYYDGLGARCIASIKGRTFIAGTVDKEGIEEQSKVRYSIVQSGVISKDIFYEEDWLSFGHAPITALIEFREQLVVFNREAWYRMLLHSITDITSWEMIEAVEGSGTFSPKTVINTPIGFVYLHDSGIMVSEGNMARNIANDPSHGKSILAIYQSLMLGHTYLYDDLISTGHFPIEDGYNKWAELLYDANTREIIIKSPVQTTTPTSSVIDIDNCNAEYRLIFNIESQNWRTEVYDREGYDRSAGYPTTAIPLLTTWTGTGKLSLSYLDLLTARIQEKNNKMRITFGKKDIGSYEDELELEEDVNNVSTLNSYNVPIQSSFITHEIGDSQDDCLLHSVIVSLVSTSKDEDEDPFFGYELRNREWQGQGYLVDGDSAHNQQDGYVDLIQMNREAKGNGSIFDMNVITPEGIDSVESFSDNEIPIRESIVLNTPRNTQFRRMRFKWLSTKIAKLKAIRINYIVRKRRRQ